MNERAVSEVIGFIIIFGIVVSSIGLIYYNAIPALDDARENEHIENAQRSFNILQDNINDVTIRGAPARGTQIRVYQSELEITRASAEVNLTATIDGTTVSPGPTTYRSVVYRTSPGQEIVYENGGVFRFDGVDSSGIVYEPGWTVSEDRVVLPMIRTGRPSGGGEQRVSGDTTMMVRAVGGPTNRYVYNGVDVLNVTVTSPRADGWQVYMEGLDAVDPADVTRINETRVSMEIDSVERVIYLDSQVNLEIIP